MRFPLAGLPRPDGVGLAILTVDKNFDRGENREVSEATRTLEDNPLSRIMP